MPAGNVDRALLQSYYQDDGDIYDDTKTEAALEVLADQSDANWGYVAGLVANGILSPYPHGLFRNALINGGFDIWQRGTSFAIGSLGQYTADRWFVRRTSGVTGATISQQTGDTSRYCIRMQRDSGNGDTNQIWLSQLVETANMVPLREKEVTLSFRARCGANYSAEDASLSVSIRQGTDVDGGIINSGGAVVGNNVIATNNVQLTTSWQDFSITGTVGGNTYNVLQAFFVTGSFTGSSGIDDWVEIEQVQLCTGSVALPYQPRPVSEELSMCQRYCIVFNEGISFAPIGQGMAGSTSEGKITVVFPHTLRESPTLTVTASEWSLADGSGASSVASAISIAAAQGGTKCLILSVTATGLTQFRPYSLRAENDTGAMMIFDAEL